MRKIARRRLDVLPRRLLCRGSFPSEGVIPHWKRVVPLAEHGNPGPPSGDAAANILLGFVAFASSRHNTRGENTNRGINCLPCPPHLIFRLSSAYSPSPLNNTTIIYPLIIGHSTPAPSCIVFVPVKIANSGGLTDKQAYGICITIFFKAHIFGIFVTLSCYDENAQQMKDRLLDAFKAISKYVAGRHIDRAPRILNDNARWHCLQAAKNTS